MPPKKKPAVAKKKDPELSEPPHDPNWERAVISGVWHHPVTMLPDATTWPSWGALRERVLAACREVRISGSPTVRDVFAAELIKLSPPRLAALDFSCSRHLRHLVLSPLGACPALSSLALAGCAVLEHVLLQSASLRRLDLNSCVSLDKALIQCPRLSECTLAGCTSLRELSLWSDELEAADLGGVGPRLQVLRVHAPRLDAQQLPTLVPSRPFAMRPAHPPISCMLREARLSSSIPQT